jgi:hypothetical protein
MSDKRPKAKEPRRDDPHLRAKSQLEQHRKSQLHRPAARMGEMRRGKGG